MAASCNMCCRIEVGFLLFVILVLPLDVSFGKTNKDYIEDVDELKEFKKLIRTKTNVLALFTKSIGRGEGSFLSDFATVAEAIRGQGTLAKIDCGGDGKKLCKQLKVSPAPMAMRHYLNGEYHKDYDRKWVAKSMISFLKDPTSDVPWDEEEGAQDVYHVYDGQGLLKLLRKERLPTLIMFYAPWCGFCKKLKPEFSSAATKLKNKAILAGMDVNKPENAPVSMMYNITGYPTLIYFERGEMLFRFSGEHTEEGIIKFMENPQPPSEAPKEEAWSEKEDTNIVHLTDNTFDEFVVDHPSVTVMFYAPWCGHCKKMKPEFEEAALILKNEKIDGILAAVDATKETMLAERFEIKGFPTTKYFENGEPKFDVHHRTADSIVEFVKDPKEPPPPPPPEPAWEEIPSNVEHLNDENFKSFLKRKKHALVMFYAPWCGHCKKAKPEFQTAAEQFKENPKVAFVGVDCTVNLATCKEYEVTGYPTIKYFSYLKTVQDYMGKREEQDFVHFMSDPTNPMATAPPPPPPEDEEFWTNIEGAEAVNQLTTENFNSFISEHPSTLVMFYAPWCGHCKNMKPAYAAAAGQLKKMGASGALAVIDATVESEIGTKYDIKGFPTLKYFKNGDLSSDYALSRTTEDIVGFMLEQETEQKSESKDEL